MPEEEEADGSKDEHLHFVLASMGLSASQLTVLDCGHAPAAAAAAAAEPHPQSPSLVLAPPLQKVAATMKGSRHVMHAGAVLLTALVLPVFLRMILWWCAEMGESSRGGSSSSSSPRSEAASCKDSSSPFLNLTSLLENITAVPKEAGAGSTGGWLARISGRRRLASHAKVQVLYVADAYAMSPADSVDAAYSMEGRHYEMCSVYCCRPDRDGNERFAWLLGQAAGRSSIQLSVVSSATLPPSRGAMATFLKGVHGIRVPEDWNLHGFQDALAKSCHQVQQAKQLYMQHPQGGGTSSTSTSTFDDALVPSRLCSSFSVAPGESTAPRAAAQPTTIGSLLRLVQSTHPHCVEQQVSGIYVCAYALPWI